MKFGLFYEICVPKPWTPGKEARMIREVIEQIVVAEKYGFEYVWFTEHHFLEEFSHCSAPEILLGALSQVTKKIRLGHGVVLTPPKYNHPVRVAERIAMLDIISNGRVELGTGRSVTPRELEGFDINAAESRDMWMEGTQLVARLLSEEKVSYEGKYVRMPERTVLPRCVQKPHPPMWLAGTSPDSAKRAAESGLGVLFFSTGLTPEMLKDTVKIYRETIKSAKPIAGNVNNQLAGFCTGLCGKDDAEARRTGSRAAWWYNLMGAEYSSWPKGVEPPKTYEYTKERMAGAADKLRATGPEGMLKDDVIMVGDPDRCAAYVKRFQDVGVDQLIIHMQAGGLPHKRMLESITQFGKYVIPRFKKGKAKRAGKAKRRR
ncbi:MAG: LLM class flavin-dependent oxidoreductase [Chloroflexi bacterium]|nr:LLM class flavin-dependent oxidoreductase [Chloroflexota bacterium]